MGAKGVIKGLALSALVGIFSGSSPNAAAQAQNAPPAQNQNAPKKQEKVPVPFVSEAKEKEIRTTYATELASQTPDAALKLLEDAVKTTDDGAAQYRLLELARSKAASVYDFNTAFKAADKLDEIYADINVVGIKLTMVEDGRKGAKSREQQEAVAGAGLEAAIAAVNNGIETKNKSWYDAAAKAASGAETDAKKLKNKLLEEKANAIAKYAKDMSGNGQTGEITLAKYSYFVLNDTKALDALSKNVTEPKLKKFAGLTIMSTNVPESYYELGDAAYDAVVEAKVAFEKRFLQEKSLEMYRQALSVATGATKTKLERDAQLKKRIDDLEKKLADSAGMGVDILGMVDAKKDAVSGEWTQSGKMLTAPAVPQARLQLPYIPPAEYEISLLVEPKGGSGAVHIGLPSGKKQFLVMLYPDWAAYELLDGNDYNATKANIKGLLTQNKQNTVQCIVRKDGFTVIVDGKKALEYKGDMSRLSLNPSWKVSNDDVPYIGSFNSDYRVNSVTLKPISGGQGKKLR